MTVPDPPKGSERWIKERRWRRLTMLQRCLVISLLIHLLICFLFSLIVVSRHVAVFIQDGDYVEMSLQSSSESAVSRQLRNTRSSIDVPDPTLNEQYQTQRSQSASAASRARTVEDAAAREQSCGTIAHAGAAGRQRIAKRRPAHDDAPAADGPLAGERVAPADGAPSRSGIKPRPRRRAGSAVAHVGPHGDGAGVVHHADIPRSAQPRRVDGAAAGERLETTAAD